MSERGLQVDMSYRRKAAKRGIIDEVITRQQETNIRLYGAVQAVDTSDFHTIAHEAFSLARYQRVQDSYSGTTQDALKAAAVLQDVYKSAFPGHRIQAPMEAIKLRRRDVSRGWRYPQIIHFGGLSTINPSSYWGTRIREPPPKLPFIKEAKRITVRLQENHLRILRYQCRERRSMGE